MLENINQCFSKPKPIIDRWLSISDRTYIFTSLNRGNVKFTVNHFAIDCTGSPTYIFSAYYQQIAYICKSVYVAQYVQT